MRKKIKKESETEERQRKRDRKRNRVMATDETGINIREKVFSSRERKTQKTNDGDLERVVNLI